MLHKEKFSYLTSFLEKMPELMSILDIDNSLLKLDAEFFKPKCEIIFIDSKWNKKIENIRDIIFKSKADFYIYLSKEEDYMSDSFDIKIIYTTKQRTDVILFASSLSKSKI